MRIAFATRFHTAVWRLAGAMVLLGGCRTSQPAVDMDFQYARQTPNEDVGSSSVQHPDQSSAMSEGLPMGSREPIVQSRPGQGNEHPRANTLPSEHSERGRASSAPQPPQPIDSKIVFLHHSTGELVWRAGVREHIAQYNSRAGKRYAIAARAYPDGKSYPWDNYPFDYWNIWVAHAGPNAYSGQATLEILTREFDVIVLKHCFPVSAIESDIGQLNPASPRKSLENYRVQYMALRDKMRTFPKTRFLVWTGAALKRNATNSEQAIRARAFVDWVKATWDEPGDNIFVWDFFGLETEGGVYLTDANATEDSHPNEQFVARVAPLLARRIVDVVEGRGDST